MTSMASARRKEVVSPVISALTVSPGRACRTKTTRPSGARATQPPPPAMSPTSSSSSAPTSSTAGPASVTGRTLGGGILRGGIGPHRGGWTKAWSPRSSPPHSEGPRSSPSSMKRSVNPVRVRYCSRSGRRGPIPSITSSTAEPGARIRRCCRWPSGWSLREWCWRSETAPRGRRGRSTSVTRLLPCAPGSYAERLIVPAPAVVPKPSTFPFEEGAGLMLAGTTAVHALVAVGVTRGETLLLHGAAGGVGLLAVQLAVAQGVRVIGTASEGLMPSSGGWAPNRWSTARGWSSGSGNWPPQAWTRPSTVSAPTRPSTRRSNW